MEVITRVCVCADHPEAYLYCACTGCTAARIAAHGGMESAQHIRQHGQPKIALLDNALDLLSFPATQNDINVASRNIYAVRAQLQA